MARLPLLSLVLGIAVLGCSSVRFEPNDPKARRWPISRKTMVRVVADPTMLEQPTYDLGALLTRVRAEHLPDGEGVEELKERAWRYGCDALGQPREEAAEGGFRWTARCLRSGRFELRGADQLQAVKPRPAEPAPAAVAEAPAAPPPAAAPDSPAKAPASQRAPASAPAPPARPAAEPPAAQDPAAAAKARAKAEAAQREAERAAEAQLRRDQATFEREQKQKAAAAQKREAEEAARARKAAEAEEKRRTAEEKRRTAEEKRLRAEEADKARQAALEAEKARKAAEDEEKRRRAEEKRRKAEEADKARQAALEAEKARKSAEAAEVARKKAEADALAAAEAVAQRKAAAKQAIEDKTSAAQLDFLARWPDADEGAEVFAALQRAAVDESPNWLGDVACTPSAALLERRLPPATLQADLAAAKTTRWRSLVPREVQCTYSLRNPTPHPVVLDLDLPAGPTHRFLPGKQTATVKQSVRCRPAGSPTQTVQNGQVEYRYACQADGPARLTGLSPAAAELAVDKRAGDPAAPFEVLAKVWQAKPNTRLGRIYADLVAERMHAEQDDVSRVDGKQTLLQKPAPGQPTPVRVSFRNAAGRDVTVLYTVGTGRDERLLLPKAGSQEVLLKTLPGVDPDLQVTSLLPALRSLDWLVGSWVLGNARLVMLPAGTGRLVAFPLVSDATGTRRAVPAVTALTGGVLSFQAHVGGAWLGALLGKTPPACQAACEAKFVLRLSSQDQYVVGGSRMLVLEVEAAGQKAVAKLAED